MSFNGSDAASEIDPLFHTIGISHPVSVNRGSSTGSPDDFLRPVIAFPLPPRRLCPGDLVASPQVGIEKSSQPPVALYGVAIGGGNTSRATLGAPGRAEVKTDNYPPHTIRQQRLSAAATKSSPDKLRYSDCRAASLRAKNPTRHLTRGAHSPVSLNLITLAEAPSLSSSSQPSPELSKLTIPQRPPRPDSLISFPSDDGFSVPPEFHLAAHNGALNHGTPSRSLTAAARSECKHLSPPASGSASTSGFHKTSSALSTAAAISVSPDHTDGAGLRPPDQAALFASYIPAQHSTGFRMYAHNSQPASELHRSRSDHPASEPGKLVYLDPQHEARLKAVSQALQIDDINEENNKTTHQAPLKDTVGQEDLAAGRTNADAHRLSTSPEQITSSPVHRIRFAPPPRRSFITPEALHTPTHRRAATEGSNFVASKQDALPSILAPCRAAAEGPEKPSRSMATKKSGWKALFSSQTKKQILSRPSISLPLPETFLVTASGRLSTPSDVEFKRTIDPPNGTDITPHETPPLSFPTRIPRRASIDNLLGSSGAEIQPDHAKEQYTDLAPLRPRSRSFSGLASYPAPLQVDRPDHGLQSVLPPSRAPTDHPSAPPKLSRPMLAPIIPPNTSTRPATSPSSHSGAPKSTTSLTSPFRGKPDNSAPIPSYSHMHSSVESKVKKQVRFRRSLEHIPDPSFLAYRDASRIREGQPLKPTANRPGTAYREDNAPFPAPPIPEPLPHNPPPNLNNSMISSAYPVPSQRPNKIGLSKKAGKGMKLLIRPRQIKDTGDNSSPNSPPGTGSSVSPQETMLRQLEFQEQRARKHAKDAEVEADDQVDLLSRTLAPKLNLTFVDLDHHIGSRFSVRTLFKEVQKALPEVSPLELTHKRSQDDIYARPPSPDQHDHRDLKKPSLIPYHDPNVRNIHPNMQPGSSPARPPQPQLRPQTAPTEQQSQVLTAPHSSHPVSGTRRLTLQEYTSQRARARGQESGPRLPRADELGSRSDSRDTSSVELVDAQGRELSFQMVIPQAKFLDASRVELPQRRAPGSNEDELRQISERLVQLHTSLEASQRLSERGPVVPKEKKLERVETWLSSVPPSAAHSPSAIASTDHRPLDWPFEDALASRPNSEYDEQEKWDEDCPESPIDRYANPFCLARSGSKTKAMLVVRNGNLRARAENGGAQAIEDKAEEGLAQRVEDTVTVKLELPARQSQIGPKKAGYVQTGLVRVRTPSDSSSGASPSMEMGVPKLNQMVAIVEGPTIEKLAHA